MPCQTEIVCIVPFFDSQIFIMDNVMPVQDFHIYYPSMSLGSRSNVSVVMPLQ